jgi:hypothetical protein
VSEGVAPPAVVEALALRARLVQHRREAAAKALSPDGDFAQQCENLAVLQARISAVDEAINDEWHIWAKQQPPAKPPATSTAAAGGATAEDLGL